MYTHCTCRVVVVIITIEVENEEAVEEEEEAVQEVAVVDIITNKTNPRRNPSLTLANIWTRKFVYDSMAVEKVYNMRHSCTRTQSWRYSTVVGTLMGYDPLLNLVLDNTIEYQKGIYTAALTIMSLLYSLCICRFGDWIHYRKIKTIRFISTSWNSHHSYFTLWWYEGNRKSICWINVYLVWFKCTFLHWLNVMVDAVKIKMELGYTA